MKWSFNHKSRKAFLTAAICLALSQSVFAMPTGGEVQMGKVTGIENGTVANGGTINVNGNTLIDWNKFNIDKNESLNFVFTQDYTNVINHVTGSEMSKLLGELTAGKNGNVYLINPNGILIGQGARIDVGGLILSTLDASDEQLMNVLNNKQWNLDLEGKTDSQGITIENGANLTAGTLLNLFGNKIQIADNVTISDTAYDKNETTLVVAAAQKATLNVNSSSPDIESVTTGQENTVDIGKATFNINNEYTDSYFLGNDINMEGTTLNLSSRNPNKSSSSLDIMSVNEYKVDDEPFTLSLDQGNHLNLDSVTASADYMHVIGGTTSINDSDLTLTKTTDEFKQGEPTPYMTVAALNGTNVIFDDIEGSIKNATNENGANLTIKDSNLTSNENIALLGGSVELTNTNLKTLKETNDKANNIDIEAFKSLGDDTMTTDSFNTVKVTGGSMESGGDILVQGSSVAFDGVKNVKAEEGIFLIGGKQFKSQDDDTELTGNTAANAVSVKDTTMNTTHAMALIGGKVDVTNTNLMAGDLEVKAGQSYTNEGNTITGTDTTNVSVSGSTIKAAEDATFFGANVDLTKTNLTVGTPGDKVYLANGVVRIAAGKDINLVDTDDKGYVVGVVNGTGNLTMTDVNLQAQGNVIGFGKNITVQKSSLSTTNDQDISLNAMNYYKYIDGDSDTWTADKDNIMKVLDTKLTNQGLIELSAGNVTVDKSDLTATGKEGFVMVDARQTYTDSDDGAYVNTATPGMDVNIKDTNLSGENGVMAVGNTVTIDGQSSAKSSNLKVFFGTGSKVEMTDDSLKGNGADVNIGKDVVYDANNTLFAPGKKIIETKPADKPIVTPDPKPAVDIEKNIEQGKQDMTKALADNPDQTVAAAKQQAEKLSNSDMTAEEKAAQFKGYADAIQETQATAEEKQDLIKETVKSFEPTQQAGLEAQNKQDEAAQNQNAKAVIPDVTVKTDSPAAHEDVAAEVTVDGQAVHE